MKQVIQHEIIERIRHLMTLNNFSQSSLSKLIGLDPSNVSKYLSGRLSISDSLLNKLVVNLGVSKAWLKNGEGLPYDKAHHATTINKHLSSQLITTQTINGVPVYDIDVTAGCAELSRMFTTDRIVGMIDLPSLNRDCCIVHVSGNSMEPVVNNGGYIAIRRIAEPSNIFWGQIYVVVLEDYRMVKYIRRHIDPQKVILHSANPEYDDMEINRSDIIGLYLVESILNFDIRG